MNQNYSLFLMDTFYRQSLVETHCFFIAQSKSRLLSQFSDLKSDSYSLSEEWLRSKSDHFDPDCHDPGELVEHAEEMTYEYFQLLNEMHNMTRLNVVSGMFNLWEKTVREWFIKEVMNWHRGDHICRAIWMAKFHEIMDLFTGLGWKIRDEDFFTSLNHCRHVVNVYKHGGGQSFEELKRDCPHFFKSNDLDLGFIPPISYNDLAITDEDLETFSTAIVEFWRLIPERVRAADIVRFPKWFDDALNQDIKAQKEQPST